MLGRHDARQVFLVGHQQIKPLAQDDAAFFTRLVAPCRPGGISCGNRLCGLGRTQVSDVGQFGASGRIQHIKAAATDHPLAIDERIGFEQAGVFEQKKRGRILGHGAGRLVMGKGGQRLRH